MQLSAAVGIVVHAGSGRVLALERPYDATHVRSAPGSILKPLFLATALRDGAVHPETTIFCRRSLRIGGHALECTHPQANIAFAAQDALAYSCNTYFAALAKRLSIEEIAATLRDFGLPPSQASEAAPSMLDERKQMLVLGVAGIVVSTAQIAQADRKLLAQVKEPPRPGSSIDPLHAGSEIRWPSAWPIMRMCPGSTW